MRAAPWLGVFAGAGAVVAGMLALLFVPLNALTGGTLAPAVFLVVAASVIPKWANYLLVAAAMAWGFIVQRLVATLLVAAVVLAAAVVAASTAGAPALAWVTVGGELLLFALLGGLVRSRVRARMPAPAQVAT